MNHETCGVLVCSCCLVSVLLDVPVCAESQQRQRAIDEQSHSESEVTKLAPNSFSDLEDFDFGTSITVPEGIG